MLPDNAKSSPRGNHPSPEVAAIALEAAQRRRATPRTALQSSEERRAAIADAAYRIAQSRGFEPGHELDDWLAAEEQVNQRLIGEGRNF
ncbi:MAG: DUF2934 domain-containing protein [Steroidobacterales bacterium]